MITINEKIFVTKQINEIMCRYAKKTLVKKFLLNFSFQNSIDTINELESDDINPLLVTLNFYDGIIESNNLDKVEEFISNFMKHLDENDLTALYFLTINKNFSEHIVDFENTDDAELINNQEDFDEQLGRELAYKIYEPEATGLNEKLEELLKNYISTLSVEVDLSEPDENTVEYILEAIESIVN